MPRRNEGTAKMTQGNITREHSPEAIKRQPTRGLLMKHAWLRQGTYNEAVVISKSGTAERPLVIKAYGAEWELLDGADLRLNGISNNSRKKPGPAAGPSKARLGDGSVAAYYP